MKKLFDEQNARWLVMERRDEGQDGKPVRSLKEFAKECRLNGVTQHIVSIQTLTNLFTGKMYPTLKDENDRPFDWSLIPRSRLGRRSTNPDASWPQQLRRIEDSIAELRGGLQVIHLKINRLLHEAQ